jgi:uridine kinase
MPDRAAVLGRVADHLHARRPGHPLRVAVDGITAAGKTTVARELTGLLAGRGRPAVHLSMDGYHHRRAHRHRQGSRSATGYYADGYDFDSFARLVLSPLGAGTGGFVPKIIELATDEPVEPRPVPLTADGVLVVDGSFLQRPELAGMWDEVVFLDTAFDVARGRGVARDAAAFGGSAAADRAYRERYHAAGRMYLDRVDPAARASILLGHDDPRRPVLRRIGGPAGGLLALFSYGTLRQPEVQRATFGRLLPARADTLPGYRLGWTAIDDAAVVTTSGSDRHPIAVPGAPDDSIDGAVLTLSAEDLAAADT